ncbi:MAG TPA: hypothetical protein VFN22_12995 [Gemmatimonadales bacterium]|nr:hypothetical protein [Gemmatimonadales bacterium]
MAPIQRGFDVQLAQADSTMAAVLRQMRENVIVADVSPYFERILFGPEGRLLVSQARPVVGPYDVGPPPNARWDLFDHEGRYLGVLELPMGLRVLTSTADAIYAIANSPTGGQAVVKLV